MVAQPVQPVNYAQLLMQGLTAGLGSYQQISQIERQEKRDVAADEERIFKERVGLSAQIHNKPISQQIPTLEAHIQRIKAGGRDTVESERLLNILKSEDPTEAQDTFKQFYDAGESMGLVAKKPAIIQEAERLFPGDLISQNTYIKEARFKPQTQVTFGGVGEEQKALAKHRVKRLGIIQDKADVAQNNISSLDRLDAIDVSTGRAEPMKQALAAWGKSFGIDTSKLANVAAGDAFTAESGRTVLNVMAAQKGPQTESDMKQIRTTVATLKKDPRANKFINDSARAISSRAIEQRDFYEAYLDENKTLQGVSKEWNDFKRNTPMVSKHSKDNQGLPVFFYRFYDRVKEANPAATREQILSRWKQLDIPVWKETNLQPQQGQLTPAPLNETQQQLTP